MDDAFYIAVDLGAGSGRVFLAGFAAGECLLEEAHRFLYPPLRDGGHLCWNLPGIIEEIQAGLRLAGERARQFKRTLHSIGVDSWAVDYGLIDAAGNLIESPICYRDDRTQGVMERVFARLPREEIFARTGIQFLSFNTLFQLYAQAEAGIAADAARLLMMPDLIHHFLTGRAVTEYTNATTTQLVNATTGAWDSHLIERLELPGRLLAEIVPAGTDLGALRPALADELQLENVRVVAPATHDTASAVIGAPLKEGWAYISSGTWSLVGVERDGPLINAEVARHNFTNEGGAFGTIRFLKNVMGLWILESCRKEWQARDCDVDYDTLLNQVGALQDVSSLIYPDDARFFNPPSMIDAISAQLAETGQAIVTDPPLLAKVILDSLALRYASVLRTVALLTKREVVGVQIVGGGSRNDYLNQATATASGLMVLAGPVEATATGNALVQAIAHGRFASLAEARQHVAGNITLKQFAPRPSPQWTEAARRYTALEARYSSTSSL
ncbi:MAG: rhamnulokinase family protein [Blastocatellia bacterium]